MLHKYSFFNSILHHVYRVLVLRNGSDDHRNDNLRGLPSVICPCHGDGWPQVPTYRWNLVSVLLHFWLLCHVPCGLLPQWQLAFTTGIEIDLKSNKVIQLLLHATRRGDTTIYFEYNYFTVLTTSTRQQIMLQSQ